MNIRYKMFLTSQMESMFVSWHNYMQECYRQRRDLKNLEKEVDIPDGYKTAMQLAEVNVDIEKKMSVLDGACRCLGYVAVFDPIKDEIRVEDRKGKVLFWTNGNESNYDLEEIYLKFTNKYPEEVEYE